MPLHVTNEDNEIVKQIIGLSVDEQAAPLSIVQPLSILSTLTKYSLQDLTPGQNVIINEANRVEKYLGPISGEEGAGITIIQGGDVVHLPRQGIIEGKPFYSLNNIFDDPESVYWEPNGGSWQIGSNVIGTGGFSDDDQDVNFPWEVSSWQGDPLFGLISVIRNNAASKENWAIISRDIEYDVGPLGFIQTPDSEETDWILIPRPLTIPSGSPGVSHCLVTPASNTTFDIYINENIIGSLVFTTGNNVGQIDIFNDVSVTTGDRIALVAPAIPDSTLRNLQLILRARAN